MAKTALSSLRMVVFVNENKTPDFAFRSMAAWGADITELPAAKVLKGAPDHDQPHDRNSWVHYRMGDYPAEPTQIDNDSVQPFHAYLAKMFTFSDHHFGIGSNSTSGHMLIVGGQTPTLKNPPFGPGGPKWDLPSIFTHAARKKITWAAVPDGDQYPVKFYSELNLAANALNVHPTSDITNDAFIQLVQAGKLPQLSYVWGPAGADEHPPFRISDPAYLSRADDLLWRRVDAVVKAGQWDSTVFILTYDDWGGYADHVLTPVLRQQSTRFTRADFRSSVARGCLSSCSVGLSVSASTIRGTPTPASSKRSSTCTDWGSSASCASTLHRRSRA